MEPIVRTAREDDAPDVARIGTASMRAQYQGLVDPVAVEAAIAQSYSLDALVDCIDRCSRSRTAQFLVAELDDTVAGYLHFDDFGPEPELHRIYVDPTVRRSGVGSLLLAELHARLPTPAHYMLLVLEGNDRAITFYQRHGFDIDAQVDGLDYYRDRMGVTFPEGTRPFQLVLMRR
jgi:ribosomal protein S18 acetylase RimI-like enzyme